MQRVVAINGSPRMHKGNTSLILEPFLAGVREAGAAVDVLYAKSLDVRPCTGELHCWWKEPGVCCIKDTMQEVYPKLRQTDTLVLAIPMYIPMPGEMQNLVNRLCPLIDPVLVTRDGRTRAQFRADVNIRRIALVASSGWWEGENMDTLVRIVREIAEDASVLFAGALVRPHAHALRAESPAVGTVLNAAREAGRALVELGCIPAEAAEVAARPLLSREAYLRQPS